MKYTTSAGLPESALPDWLKKAALRYGTFADGRVNYHAADTAPTVMCTLFCQGKILLVKRALNLADANGYWSTVNGFIDEIRPVAEQAAIELREELGLTVNPRTIRVASSYTLHNQQEIRSYIVFPCLIQLAKQPAITLNEENTDYTWVTRDQIANFHILDDLPQAIEAALHLATAANPPS